MKTDKEILDEFGKILIEDVYDHTQSSLQKYMDGIFTKPEDTSEFIRTLSDDKKKYLKQYIQSSSVTTLFDFLKIFEEHKEFKLVYEENGTQVNLEKISEMLKAEILSKVGWIARFSKHIENDDK